MIHNFKAANFYSIGEEITVDLESRKEVVNIPELYFNAPLNRKVVKIEFIGGPNASGKTNVLRALAFLRHLIVDSAIQKTNEIGFRPFLPNRNQPSELSVSFSFDQKAIYQYRVQLFNHLILEEQLDKKTFVNERQATSMVFQRRWRQQTQNYDVNLGSDLVNFKQMTNLQTLLKSNQQVSLISLLNNFDTEDGLLRQITHFWGKVVSNIMMVGIAETEFSFTKMSATVLREIYEQKKLREKVSQILRRYDLGFASIIKKEKMGPNQDETVYGINHVYDKGTTFAMSMHLESNGTKRLIILMQKILEAITTGGVAVIDEMDAFLHPDIYDEIIEMFMSITTNHNNAQLIFSAQNYTVLARLDKQQVTLAEKNATGQTEVWRLDDLKGIRADDNFYAKYLTGAYGAIPKIS